MITKPKLLELKNLKCSIHLITVAGLHFNGWIIDVFDGYIVIKDKFDKEVSISIESISILKNKEDQVGRFH